MGGTLGAAACGDGLYQAQVRWANGCTGRVGRGTTTLGACGTSMLEGFCTLVNGGCTLGGRRSSHLSFSLCWGAVSSLGVMSAAQSVSVSFRYRRARIWSPDRENGAPWRAAINFCSLWSTLSSGVTDGCVIWWCLNYVVSGIIIDLVSFMIMR